MRFALPRQILLFLATGAVQLLLDWAVFVSLTHLGLALLIGNIAGRMAGAGLGFWLNGRYTFADSNRSGLTRAHLARFILAWSLLTGLSTLLLYGVAQRFDLQAAWLAKPLVEALMAAIGFVTWRQWVFRWPRS